MKDFFSFRRMITPYIIMVIFWLAIVVLVLSLAAATIGVLSTKNNSAILALCVIWPIGLPLGILMIRIYCELLILFFRMNETLTDIKNEIHRQRTQ
jgi:hypothetical protein